MMDNRLVQPIYFIFSQMAQQMTQCSCYVAPKSLLAKYMHSKIERLYMQARFKNWKNLKKILTKLKWSETAFGAYTSRLLYSQSVYYRLCRLFLISLDLCNLMFLSECHIYQKMFTSLMTSKSSYGPIINTRNNDIFFSGTIIMFLFCKSNFKNTYHKIQYLPFLYC